jgi:hypothetical protein
MCQRGTVHLATLKSKKYKMIAFLEIETGMAEKSALGPGKQTAKTWFGLEK